MNKLRQELRNFTTVLAKYESYLKKKEDINRIDSSIDYLNTFVDEDSIKMVKYLKENHYADEDNKVLKKGIMASEISECNEIMLTEIINQDFFLELNQAEIVAVLAAFLKKKVMMLRV